MKVKTTKYKVSFQGFCYVKADSKEEAIECADNDEIVYAEKEYTSVEEVEDFVVET